MNKINTSKILKKTTGILKKKEQAYKLEKAELKWHDLIEAFLKQTMIPVDNETKLKRKTETCSQKQRPVPNENK